MFNLNYLQKIFIFIYHHGAGQSSSAFKVNCNIFFPLRYDTCTIKQRG